MAEPAAQVRPDSAAKTILVVIGTRPEAIKLASVVRALERRVPAVVVKVLATAQHRELLDEMLRGFAIHPDFDLDLMTPDQSPHQVLAAVVAKTAPILDRVRPDWVVVQGDTTTTLGAALAAAYARCPLAHVEAGLRTGDRHDPFPEEINRILTTHAANLHFAPTEAARARLLHEGIEPTQVQVTGNTVIDTLLWTVARQPPSAATGDRRRVVVTAHRRESFGAGLAGICEALARIARRRGPAVEIIFPVHPNPQVREQVARRLAGIAHIRLEPPLPYPPFVRLLADSFLILTDSGGIQEEAPSLDRPVLVLRELTERGEGIEAGTAELVGTDPARIVSAFDRLWDDPEAYQRMAQAPNPYGDGRAAERIAAALLMSPHPAPALTPDARRR